MLLSSAFVHSEGVSPAILPHPVLQRFPTWLWRNEEVATFLTWLRDRNRDLLDDEVEMRLRSVGFYGLDIYSLAASSTSVISFLDKVDPAAGKRARKRYGCFDK